MARVYIVDDDDIEDVLVFATSSEQLPRLKRSRAYTHVLSFRARSESMLHIFGSKLQQSGQGLVEESRGLGNLQE